MDRIRSAIQAFSVMYLGSGNWAMHRSTCARTKTKRAVPNIECYMLTGATWLALASRKFQVHRLSPRERRPTERTRIAAERNESLVEYALYGSFDPSNITSRTGIVPHQTSRRGDLIGNTRRRYEEDRWLVRSRNNTAEEGDDNVSALLEQLKPGWKVLRELGRLHYAKIIIVLYIWDGQDKGLFLDRNVLTAIEELNAEVDLDMLHRVERGD